MAAERLAGREKLLETRVLPLRAEKGRVPSSVLVRQALRTVNPSAEVVRSAVAIAIALDPEGTRSRGRGGQEPVDLADVAIRTGLSAGEVKAGLDALSRAGVLSKKGEGRQLDPDLFCTLPALAELDWDGCRISIEAVKGRVAPSLALLREVARMSGLTTTGGSSWLHSSIQELVEETLYGRTAVTQALGNLTRAKLLERVDQPPRKGLRIRLAPRAFGRGNSDIPTAAAPDGIVPNHEARTAAGRSEGGVTVRVGGAEIGVPAGSRLQLPGGVDYRLEIGPGGGVIIRMDD